MIISILNNRAAKKIIRYLISFILLFGIWHIAAKILNMPLLMPSPFKVAERLAELFQKSEFQKAMISTAFRCLLAFAYSICAGIAIGILCAKNQFCADFLEPILTFIRSVPVVSFILVALFYLKTNSIPIAVAFLMALPVMIDSTRAGFHTSDSKCQKYYSLMGLSPAKIFFFIQIQFAQNHIKSGMSSCAGMIWKIVTAGEVLTLPKNALGSILSRSQIVLEIQDVFAITIAIVFASFLTCSALKVLLGLSNPLQRLFCRFYFACKSPSQKTPPVNFQNTQSENNNDIVISNLNITRDRKIFSDFNIIFEKNKVTAIVAPSGEGKTTLLDWIADNFCKKNHHAGKNSCSKSENFQTVSYITQETYSIPNLTAVENIMLPLMSCMSKHQAKETALSFLKAVHLEQKADFMPSHLSGGEKQRIGIAMAFAYPSQILLMDEAFRSQDIGVKAELIDILSNLIRQCPRTVIFVTHVIQEALCISDRIICLKGRPAEIALDTAIEHESKAKTSSQFLNPTQQMTEIETCIKNILCGKNL